MMRNALPVADENESPRNTGLVSVDFRIHQVAQSNGHSGKRDGKSQVVANPHIVYVVLLAVFTGIPPYPEQDGDCSSVAGKSAVPYLQDFSQMLLVIIPLIEKHMAEPGSHKSAYQKHIQHRVQELGRKALPLVELCKKPVAEYEA